MNSFVLSCVAKVVYRRCRSFDWWPFSNFAEWMAVSPSCVSGDLFKYQYVCVCCCDGRVDVRGFNSLSGMAGLAGDCEVFRVAEIEEGFKHER